MNGREIRKGVYCVFYISRCTLFLTALYSPCFLHLVHSHGPSAIPHPSQCMDHTDAFLFTHRSQCTQLHSHGPMIHNYINRLISHN